MTGASPDMDKMDADEAAIEWAILLREEPEDAELKAGFEAWLAASPRHAAAWAATAHAYDRAGDLRPLFTAPLRAAEARPVLPTGPAPYRRRPRSTATHRWRPNRRQALAAGLAACLMLIAAPSLLLRVEATYRTGTAQVRRTVLADGTIAQLAPDSAIAVTYAANRRQVRLLKGEAWFDVRHDAARPFYVDAGGITTTDIGTAFDVRLERKGVTTEVSSGQVRVAYSGAPPISEPLSRGDSLHVGFDGIMQREQRPAGQMAAWRSGQIIVRDRPAGEVIAALRPWFAGVILLRDESFARQRVTGLYNATRPVEALQGLAQAYGGSVTTITPWVIVVSSGR
ncbi:MAG TPA: FecR domain-containing protein [Novosphingobium sp.]|nr:FecR domain-containing protein [Novosphingobium sp.]